MVYSSCPVQIGYHKLSSIDFCLAIVAIPLQSAFFPLLYIIAFISLLPNIYDPILCKLYKIFAHLCQFRGQNCKILHHIGF